MKCYSNFESKLTLELLSATRLCTCIIIIFNMQALISKPSSPGVCPCECSISGLSWTVLHCGHCMLPWQAWHKASCLIKVVAWSLQIRCLCIVGTSIPSFIDRFCVDVCRTCLAVSCRPWVLPSQSRLPEETTRPVRTVSFDISPFSLSCGFTTHL